MASHTEFLTVPVAAWAELWLLKRHHDNALPDVVGNAVPDPIRLRRLVFESFKPTRSKPVIPAIERRRLDPEHLQRPPSRQMRLLDEADDLKLLRCGEPHVWSPPSPVMLMEWRAPPQRRRHSVCGQPIRRE